MKIKSYFITTLLCLFTLLFATNFVLAGNIGRTVYGVLTETYNGTSTSASAGNDRIYIAEAPGMNTNDKIEGKKSYSIGSSYYIGVWFSSNGGWGSNPQDMSAYIGGRLYFSAKVPTTVNINNTGNVLKVEDATSAKIVYFNSDNIKRIDNGSSILGTKISNDNQWHTYYVELDSFIDSNSNNIDFTNIKYLFVIASPINNNTVLVDNVYWTKTPNATRAFNVTVKNVSDNQVLTGENEKITWSQSCFRQSWTAAEQYIELDLDQESTNWYVKIYVNNSSDTRKGLYCVDSDGSEIVLPMAWRVSRDLLPNSSGDTLQVKQDTEGKLYDSGKIHTDPAWSYSWSYFYDISDTSLVLNNTIVWNLQGCHTLLSYFFL